MHIRGGDKYFSLSPLRSAPGELLSKQRKRNYKKNASMTRQKIYFEYKQQN